MTRLAVFIFAISQNCFAQIANINTCLETSLHRTITPVQSSPRPFRFLLSSPFSGTDLFESNFSYIPRKNTRLHTSFNGSPDYATASLSADQSVPINSQWKLAVALGGFSQWGNTQRARNSTTSLPFFGGIQGQIFSDYKLNSQLHLSVSLEFDRIFLENSNLDSVVPKSPWFSGQTISITKKWNSGLTMQVLWKNHSDFQFFEVLGFLPLKDDWMGSFSLRNDYNRWGLGVYRRLQNQSVWGLTLRYHRELQTFNTGIHGSF